MSALLATPLFALPVTVAAYLLALTLYTRSERPAPLHPTIVGGTLVAGALMLSGLDYNQYARDSRWLTWLLGPATVALAVPLYRQLHLLRPLARPLLIATLLGAAFASVSAVALAWLAGAERATLLALSTKSITTPIAITVTENLGGLVTVAAGAVVLTGVSGIVMGPWLLARLGIEDDRAWGFCMGLAAHAVGTARAFERGPVAGAFASLALCLTGTVSAVLIPVAARWMAG